VLQVGNAESFEDLRARLAPHVVVETATAEVRQFSADPTHELGANEVFALQGVGRLLKRARLMRAEPGQHGSGLAWP